MTVASGLEEVNFRPGQFLFNEGETSFHFYIIQDGKVEVSKKGAKGEKIPLAVIEEGQSLGEFAMIDRQPRSASAQALTDVLAVKIPESAYEQMLKSLPEWANSVLQGLAMRMRQTNEIIKRHGIVDESIIRQIESVEFDIDAPTKLTSKK